MSRIDLVTVEHVRTQSRLPSDSGGGPDDAWLELWIPIASGMIYDWLKEEWRAYVLETDSNGDVVVDSNEDPVWQTDSDGDPVVLPVVMGATLMQLDYLYEQRQGGDGTYEMPEHAGWGYSLCRGATSVLTPLRDPTIA